jgi:hypothetical protein
MTDQEIYLGGCLCGDVRYEASDPSDAGYCHCRTCQRSSGAPVLAWAGFPTASFSYSRGEPSTFRSSDVGAREFCARCGTQIAFRDSKTPAEVYLNIASLDEPSAIEPVYHIWVASRLPWFEIADDLPRYADEGPDTHKP